MALTDQKHYRGSDLNNQAISNVDSIAVNRDATSNDELVRKSQVETISADAFLAGLVELVGDASTTTAFTSQSIVSFLAAKQDNLSIDPSSTAFAELINGTQLKIKRLTTNEVAVDATSADLAAAISGATHNSGDSSWTFGTTVLQEGDTLILTNATSAQERTFIHNGGNAGDATDFTRLQTNYDQSAIRAFFSGGTYIDYDSASGQFTLDLGTLAGELGAHTLPVDPNEFTTVTGATTLAILKALEVLINQVDAAASGGQATVSTRLDNLSGVTGSNLGTFTGALFGDSKSIKFVLQQSETAHESATTDRAAIRGEFAAADSTLSSAISAEESRALAAEASEASARASADTNLQSQITTNASSISTETSRATSAENALDTRLDIVEGADTVVGSIAKAQADAQTYADGIVSTEASARATADAGLQSQIDALSGAFIYRGYVDASGLIVHVDTGDANHGRAFENVDINPGDLYKINADQTITFNDTTSIAVNAGDSLLAIASATSTNATLANFHKIDNTESADILREGELESGYLERTGGVIKITDDSIDRAKLDSAVETDIDNKVLKSGDTMTGALMVDKTVASGTGYSGGYDYAAYVKQESVDTASLTNTQRALLVENLVYTDGSGNPADLDFANAATIASHYKGSSNTMSVATVGVNAEANVTSALAAVYATGVYGLATSEQLGVNAGGTFVAQNASTSNLGVFAFSDTAGASNNRAGYFALSTDLIDFDAYRVARVSSPLPVQDAAVIIDDYTGVKHAMYVNGKSEFNGKVIIPSAAANNEAVNLGDIKAKEAEDVVTVPASGSVTINHNLGSLKLIVSAWLDDEEVSGGVIKIERSGTNAIILYNNTASDLTDVEVYISKLS